MRLCIAILLVTSVIVSCRNKIFMPEGNAIEIKEAFLQKVYPGRIDGKITDNLNLFLEYNDAELVLDSVYFSTQVFYFQHQRKNHRLELSGGRRISDEQHYLAENKALIFYHKAEKIYRQKIDRIQRKESLYLP